MPWDRYRKIADVAFSGCAALLLFGSILWSLVTGELVLHKTGRVAAQGNSAFFLLSMVAQGVVGLALAVHAWRGFEQLRRR